MKTDVGDDDDAITGINVTPLVDVCLVLVIIFMVTAPLMSDPVMKVTLPKAKTHEGEERDKITVNGLAVELTGLQAVVTKALSTSKDKMVTISADDGNRVGDVVEILDTAKQAGAVKLAILKSEDVPSLDPGGGRPDPLLKTRGAPKPGGKAG